MKHTPFLAAFAMACGLASPAWALSAFDLGTPANGAWTMATPTLNWQASTSATSYDVYIDSKLAGSVSSSVCGYTYDCGTSLCCPYVVPGGSALNEGIHTWKVVAKDATTTQNSTSTWSVKVDATPPDVFDLLTPVANVWSASPAFTWTWQPSSDSQSGLASYELWVDGQKVSSVAAPTNTSNWVFPKSAAFKDDIYCYGNSCFCSTAGCTNPCANWYYAPHSSSYYDGCGWKVSDGSGGWNGHVQDSGTSGEIGRDVSGAFGTLLTGVTAEADLSSSHPPSTNPPNQLTMSCVVAGQQTAIGSIWDTDLPLYGSQSTIPFPFDACAGANAGHVALDFTGTYVCAWNGCYNQSLTVEQYGLRIMGVPEGPHTWYIIARDIAGNTRQSASTRTLTLDAPPLGFDLDQPADSAYTANATPALSWQATTDAGSGLDHYELLIDGAVVQTPIATGLISTVAPAKLAEGTHTWTVNAYDKTGAMRKALETRTLYADFTGPYAFDLTAPADQTVIALPTPDFSWAATSDSASGFDHFELTVDGKVYQAGSSTKVSAPDPLDEGGHTWYVTAFDKVGNKTLSNSTRVVYVDYYNPGPFDLVSPADTSTVYTLTPTLSWSKSVDTGSGVQTYEIWIDGVKNGTVNAPTTAYTLSIPLSSGVVHKWYVKAIDKGGAATSSTHTFALTVYSCQPGDTKPCTGNSVGTCNPGHYVCSDAGIWGSTCVGKIVPVAETCDGLDNSCDGVTDEGLGSTTCGTGVCKTTVSNCVNGTSNACTPLAVATSEMCDGLDNNCDGSTDEGFSPAPGTACTAGLGACMKSGKNVCSQDGFTTTCNAQSLPPGTETCNGVDDDCNGQTDDGLGQITCGQGICVHSVDKCISGVTQICNPFTGKTAETCNGFDDNCDGVTDDGLGTTSCGLGVCATTASNCVNGAANACIPLAVATTETCDGLDNNCDGSTDEGFSPAPGTVCTAGLGACAKSGKNVCSQDGTSTQCDAQPLPAGSESCNGLDDDCNGQTDDGLGQTACGKGVCAHSVDTCVAGVSQICDPLAGQTVETCNGLDDNCDGATDEGLGKVFCGVGNCTHSVDACVAGVAQICDPLAGAVTETCDNSDNDCNGQTDEGLGETSCGLGICAHTVQNCIAGGTQSCIATQGAQAETCNGLDDNCDGETDENGVCGAELDADTSSGQDVSTSEDAIGDAVQSDTAGSGDADVAAQDGADAASTDVAQDMDAAGVDAAPSGTDAASTVDAQAGTDATAGVDADASGSVPGPDVDAGATEPSSSSASASKGCTAGSAGDSGALGLAGLVALTLLIRRRSLARTAS